MDASISSTSQPMTNALSRTVFNSISYEVRVLPVVAPATVKWGG